MASKTEGAAKALSVRVLPDGARPFRYRCRVRALLGLPESSDVEMNFFKPLPVADFGYVRPRFTGEFDFSDEFLAGHPRGPAYMMEEKTRSSPYGTMPRGRGMPDEGNGHATRAQRTSARLRRRGKETEARPMSAERP